MPFKVRKICLIFFTHTYIRIRYYFGEWAKMIGGTRQAIQPDDHPLDDEITQPDRGYDKK